MRTSEEDAQTRRDHYRRSGSATEYDALLGPGSYERKPGARLWSFVEGLLRPNKREQQATRNARTPHPW
jgi:hypothetical protein